MNPAQFPHQYRLTVFVYHYLGLLVHVFQHRQESFECDLWEQYQEGLLEDQELGPVKRFADIAEKEYPCGTSLQCPP